MSLQIDGDVKLDVCPTCGSADTDHASDLSVVRHDLAELKQLLGTIYQEINPFLEQLQNSPIGKMFLGGNGK